jgi:transportin-3
LLRDTLVAVLQQYANGPRNILVQICLALSALAIQMGDWAPTAVQNLIDSLGAIPSSVPGLLQFLAILPDDVNTNTRIPLSVSLPWIKSVEPTRGSTRTSLGR